MCRGAREVIRDICRLLMIFSLAGMLSPYHREDGAGLCMRWDQITPDLGVSMGF